MQAEAEVEAPVQAAPAAPAAVFPPEGAAGAARVPVVVVVTAPQIVAPVVAPVADIRLVPIVVVWAETQHTRAAVRPGLPILRITG